MTSSQPLVSPNETIESFFKQYYGAYETHQAPNFSSRVETNDHTLLFLRQLDYRLAVFDTFGDFYDHMTVDLAYYDTQFSPMQFTTSVYVLTSYHYQRDPDDLISHHGTVVNLTLKPQNNQWMITRISPEDTDYALLKSAIDEHAQTIGTNHYQSAINDYIEKRILYLHHQRRQWDAFVETYSASPLATKQTTNAIRPHAFLVSYNGNSAATYAETFGSVFENGIFKRMEADCTNFVSQCLWAGYGGTDGVSLWDTHQLKQRVKQNFRMVDLPGTHQDWWGLNADSSLSFPSTTFMRVTELYQFCTNNQYLGPKAFGYNNNQYYWQLEGTTIHRGDVLQFYNYTKHRYSHSVVVVSPQEESYNDLSPWNIRVAQHTGDYSGRPLHQVITVFSDSTSDGETQDCKMRLLKPIPGSFTE